MDVVVAGALRLPDRPAAGEDDIGRGQERGLARDQLGRGKAERRQLVHAVIDDRRGLDMGGDGPEHRGVEPQHRAADAGQPEHLVEQPRQRLFLLGRRPAVGDAGADRLDGGALEGVELEIGQVVAGGDRLFPEEHPAMGGEAADQVLRALVDEIPAQVGKADDRRLAPIPAGVRGQRHGPRGLERLALLEGACVVHAASFPSRARRMASISAPSRAIEAGQPQRSSATGRGS